jgi:hypothetical protein
MTFDFDARARFCERLWSCRCLVYNLFAVIGDEEPVAVKTA